MTAATRSNLLFAASLSLVTAALFGVVPAVVVAAVSLFVSFGVRGPVSALRDAASSAWDAVRGVGSIRGASLSLRWCVVLFLGGVLVGRGGAGIKLPEIRWPVIDWPNVVVPDLIPDPTGPLTAVVVYETREPLSAEQYTALYSDELKSYIASHFDVRAGHAEWRIWDDDGLDISEESAELQAAYGQAVADAGGKPWIVVRRGGESVLSRELPGDGGTLLSELKRLGGE